MFSTQQVKGNTGSFSRIKIGPKKAMDKLWDGNHWESLAVVAGMKT